MDFRQLEYFVAVCEELHFTRAAEKLNISQPTLSQQIRVLESNLGTELFNRIGKKTYLTHSGEILLQHTKRIFSEIHEANFKISELRNMVIGKITIGCTGNHMIHSTILSFRDENPRVEFTLIDIPTSEIIDNVINNRFDIGIVFLPISDSQLESKLLFKTVFTLFVSTNHRLANLPYVTLDSLQQEDLILLPKNYLMRQNLDKFCGKLGVTLKPIMEVSDVYSMYQMALLNKGVTILPSSLLQSIDNKLVRQIPIIDEFPQNEVGVIYRKDHIMSPALKTFMDYLLNQYRNRDFLASTTTPLSSTIP